MSWIDRIRGWLTPAPRPVGLGTWGRNKEDQFERERLPAPSPVKELVPPDYAGLSLVIDNEHRTFDDWKEHIKDLKWQLVSSKKSESTLSKRIDEFGKDWPDIHRKYFTIKGIEARKAKGK